MADTIMPDVDRLPWLTDHVERPRRSTRFVGPFLAASAVAIIAALSYWVGMSEWLRQPSVQGQPEARVELPSPSQLIESEPAMPQVEPAPVPPPVAMSTQKEVRLDAPPVRRVAKKSAIHRSRPAASKQARSMAKSAVETKTLKYSNPWKSSGVSGRMVRIGAYGSLEKGKQAWARLAQLSPSFKKLPAVVTDLPSRTGHIYYWVQVGTTSQAHSEVLCQRMRAIGQSCLVVDLAGAQKGKGNERQPVGL